MPLKKGDPRVYDSGEDTKISIPKVVRAQPKKREKRRGGNWPKSDDSHYRKVTVSDKEPKKASPNSTTKEDKDNKSQKKFSWKKALAVSLAVAAGGATMQYAYYSASICRTIDRALSLGYTLSDLGINDSIYNRLKKLYLKINEKSSVDENVLETADEIASLGIDTLVSKIANPYEGGNDEKKDISLSHGKINTEGEEESYICINGEIYARGQGENRHQAADKLIDCVDVIVDIQVIQDYINSVNYDYLRDASEVHKKYENALRTINETAATLVRFNENGDIEVEIIKDKPKETQSPSLSKKNDDYEIGD